MNEQTEQDRRNAARAVARWHLGYAGWADRLIDAYLNPERALANLQREKDEL